MRCNVEEICQTWMAECKQHSHAWKLMAKYSIQLHSQQNAQLGEYHGQIHALKPNFTDW